MSLTWIRRRPQALFLALAFSIYLIDSHMVQSAPDAVKRLWIAAGATCDLVVVVGALYYFLLVRPGLRPRAGLVFISVMGLLRASFLFPEGALVKAALAGCAELGLLTYIGVQLAKSRKGPSKRDDPVEAIRNAVGNVLPFPGAARAMAFECSMIYYAIFSWRAKPHAPAGTNVFTMDQKAGRGDLLMMAAIASLVEIVPAHLLVRHWSEWGAWAATAISFYGAIWLAGLGRSIALRPTLVSEEAVVLRYGVLQTAVVERQNILSVQRVSRAADDAVKIPRRGEPNMELQLRRAAVVESPFGRKTATTLACTVDDPAAFLRAVS